MGLSWQQGPLAPGAIGRFLVPDPLPERLLFAEPLRRRMRVKFGGAWIADSEDVVLLHEPGRYPVAYFPLGDIFPERAAGQRAHHRSTATSGRRPGTPSGPATHSRPRAAWQHTGLPGLRQRAEGAGRVRVAGDGRVLRGGRADRRATPPTAYHRIDIRQTSRHLVVQRGRPGRRRHHPAAGAVRVRLRAALVRARAPTSTSPRSPRSRARRSARTRAGQLLRHRRRAPGGLVVPGRLDRGPAHLRADLVRAGQGRGDPGRARLRLEPGQSVIPHGIDRDLTTDEVAASSA